MSLDLIRGLPPGWSVQGLSAARSDGVNPYRSMPGHTATFSVLNPAPTYLTLRYQTFSPSAGYTFEVSQGGAARHTEQVSKKDFHSAYVDLALPAGRSTIEFRAECPGTSCLPLSLYFTSVQVIARRTVPAPHGWIAGGLALLLTLGLLLWLRPFGPRVTMVSELRPERPD